ncbi:MAG TPA: outer membrane lipoprotein carrier protein LolA [Desulfobacteraceae bacterium]|nr:outer membrane lipoprotein carrier protein LolA [Desulfobacteraceae bacterium]
MTKTNQLRTVIKSTFLLILASLSISWADTRHGLEPAAAKVTSVSAEFTQEKHMKILSRPLVSKGVFYFQVPGSLRWEYQHPVKSILLMHNGKTKHFIQKSEGFIEEAGVNLQSMQIVLHNITQWLRGKFNEDPAFHTSLEPGHKIVLIPKEKSFARLIQRIEVVLSDCPGVIKSVMIYEGRDSFTKLKFINVTLNRPLEDSLFRNIQ